MQWLALPFADPSVTPVDSAAASVVGYVLSYGPVGICALALAWLMFRGWRLVPQDFEARVRAEARGEARAEARADLVAERDRVLAEKHQAEAERAEALTVARDQLMPLLVSFTAATQALLPLLQNLVGRQGGPGP